MKSHFVERVIILIFYLLALFLFLLFIPQGYLVTSCFYFLIISLSLILAIIAQPNYGCSLKKVPFWSSFLLLFFMLGFRDVSGIDDHTYKEVFEYVNKVGVSETFLSIFMGPGYLLLNYGVGRITDNYYFFQAFASFLPLFLIYKGFEKYQAYIYIPMAILLLCGPLYFQMLSVALVRMFIAMGLIFYFSLDYLFRSKAKLYVLSVLLISTIHYSALIMLLFTPLAFSKYILIRHWKKVALLLCLVTPVLYAIVSKIAGVVGGRYAGYGEQEAMYIGLGTFYTLPFFFFCLFLKKIVPQNMQNIYSGSLLMLLMSTVFAIVFAYTPTMKRVNYYMDLSLLLLYPSIYRFSRYNKVIIAVIIIVYVFYISYFFHFSAEKHAEHLFPYRNIFFTI